MSIARRDYIERSLAQIEGCFEILGEIVNWMGATEVNFHTRCLSFESQCRIPGEVRANLRSPYQNTALTTKFSSPHLKARVYQVHSHLSETFPQSRRVAPHMPLASLCR